METENQAIKKECFVYPQEQAGEVDSEHLGRLFVFAMMWSVGAVLELEGRRRLELWLRSREVPTLPLPQLTDPEDTMFDYYVAPDGEHALHSGCKQRSFDPAYFCVIKVRTETLDDKTEIGILMYRER